MRVKTTEDFIKKATEKHNGKYDYSKVEYKNQLTKVCIVCPEHGEFWQQPKQHLKGQGCPKCSKNYKDNLNSFIEKANKKHNNKYDYSKVEYKNSLEKVCIICPEHGEFWQSPYMHIYKTGCPKCSHPSKKKTTEEFVDEARKLNGDKYDYSKVNYINKDTKVCIICHRHGEFWQSPHSHLSGEQCPKCSNEHIGELKKLPLAEFINRARKIHGDKYDYSKVDYKNTDTPVCIICPEHGEFWQSPHHHIGQSNGCPICSASKGEIYIENLLIENNIKYERQKKFEWLKRKKKMSIDFYLSDYNVAIEVQGEQHFMPVRYFGGENKFIEVQDRDKEKRKLCNAHGIDILYYSDIKSDEINCINNKTDLINEIIKYGKKD